MLSSFIRPQPPSHFGLQFSFFQCNSAQFHAALAKIEPQEELVLLGEASRRVRTAFKMIGEVTMSEKSDKLRAMLAKEKERRIKLNNRIEILERRIQEEDSAEVNEMVRTAKVTPEQLAALLRQSATTTPNPAALSAVGATFEKEDADED